MSLELSLQNARLGPNMNRLIQKELFDGSDESDLPGWLPYPDIDEDDLREASRFCREKAYANPYPDKLPNKPKLIRVSTNIRDGGDAHALEMFMPNGSCNRWSFLDDWRSGGRQQLNFNYWEPKNRENLTADYEKSLDSEHVLRPGSVERVGNRLKISCGIRRLPEPTLQEIADGVVIYQAGHEGPWTGAYFKHSFYPHLIHPHIRPEDKTSPLAWGLRCAQIANGHVSSMCSHHDFPPNAVNYPFTKLAPKICNTTPQCLLKPRTFVINHREERLFKALEKNLGEKSTPETAWFVLKNAGRITPEWLGKEDIKTLLAKMPECLENGLIIDRLDVFFAGCAKKCQFNGEDALWQVLKMVTDIYGQPNRPWWFKEDIDFSNIFDFDVEECSTVDGRMKLAYDPKGKMVVGKMSEQTGYAFEYALELFKSIGHKLCPPLDSLRAAEFCGAVARDYGVGNLPRAANVIRFAVGLMEKVQPNEQLRTLAAFEKHMHSQRPEDKLIGRMQGEDACVNMPGVCSLVKGHLGHERIKQDKLDELTIGVEHLTDLTQPLSRPLLNRAKIPPVVSGVHVPTEGLLLNAWGQGRQLALPASSQALIESGNRMSPLHGIFALYEKVRAECGGYLDEAYVIQPYFAVFASKMPDPFNPPNGFLEFLQKFANVPDPDRDDPIFHSPLEREAVSHGNAQKFVDRYVVLAELVDAWVIGALSREKLFEILKWLTEEPSAEAVEKRRLAIIAEGEKDIARCRDEHPDDDDEESDARSRRDAHIDARSLQNRILQNRFRSLAAVIRYVGVSNIFALFGMFAPHKLTELLGTELQLTEGGESAKADQPMDTSEPMDFQADKKLIMAAITEMTEHGILNKEAVVAALGAAESLLEQIKVAGSLIAMFSSFAEFRKYLEKSSHALHEDIMRRLISACPVSSFDGYIVTADQLINMMEAPRMEAETKARELIERTQEFVNVEALMEFVGSFFDAGKLVCFLAAVQKFKEGLARSNGGAQPMSEVEYSVSRITQAVGVIVALTVAAQAAGIEKPKRLTAPRRERDESLPAGLLPCQGLARQGRQSPTALITSIHAELERAQVPAREMIIEARRDTIGLLPIGGKVHVLHPIDRDRFNLFRQLTGLTSTQFQIHTANFSYILPPGASHQELERMMASLCSIGLIEEQKPEMQFGVPGRIEPKVHVPILASAILLSTEHGIEYDENSFLSNQDRETGRRMMAYDADGYRAVRMPFMPEILKGRTDILGRVWGPSGSDAKHYQLLGSVLSQAAHGGPFGHLAQGFIDAYLGILKRFDNSKKYGIQKALEEKWIYTDEDRRTDDAASSRHFHKAIKPCTDAYFGCAQDCESTGRATGIIFEVRDLFDELESQVKVEQKKLRESKDSAVCNDIRILLSF